ncbi:hypothetical protein [Novosphingobium soli]|uniref:Uncharacterized protein n=1 Tax=Novosphingobium soli TaxID=574956 RepID=A0ABV6CX43_9SPHN
MSQLNLFAPCSLLLEIQAAVRGDGAIPAKHCSCTRPCWTRNGSNSRAAKGIS